MPNERLLRSQSLDAADIRSLFAHGKKVCDKDVMLIYMRQSDSGGVSMRDCNKLGITVSSKAVKRAYQRNRIKRLFREVFRKNKHLFPASYHYLFVKRSVPEGASYNSTLLEVMNVLKKAKIHT